MRSLILLGEPGSDPALFDGWQVDFPGVRVAVLDLERADRPDCVQKLVQLARLQASPLAVCGWSEGGLIAMLAAERAGADRLVLVEPTLPAEVGGGPDSVPELGCKTLVVHGDDQPEGSLLAQFYRAEEQYFAGLDHAELLQRQKVRRAIAGWLGVKRVRAIAPTPAARPPGRSGGARGRSQGRG